MKPGLVILQIVLLVTTAYLFYCYGSDPTLPTLDQPTITIKPSGSENNGNTQNGSDQKHDHGNNNSNNNNNQNHNSNNQNNNNNNNNNNNGNAKNNQNNNNSNNQSNGNNNNGNNQNNGNNDSNNQNNNNNQRNYPSTFYSASTNDEPRLFRMNEVFPAQPKVLFKDSCGACEKYCHQRQQRKLQLCKLGMVKHCQRRYITEEVSTFWIVTPIYTANILQTERLYELHRNFRNYIKTLGLSHQVVEVIFPGQEFQVTEPNNEPYDLQYRDEWIFCMRENLVNVGVGKLPDDWAFLSWIDQHIFWEDPYWFEKSMWLMSHYNIVHLLNGNDFWSIHNTTQYHLEGFGKLWHLYGDRFELHDPRQCGLAWGMRREIYDKLGGILDICAGTKCDLYQNYAFVGRTYTAQTGNREYASMIGQWQQHAISVFQKKLGYLDSKVYHFEHCLNGCKTSEYNAHIAALIRHNYNPRTDMTRDPDRRLRLTGNIALARELWVLYGGNPRLRLLAHLFAEEEAAARNNITDFKFPHLFGAQPEHN